MIEILIYLGYGMFLNFIETEGFRHLRYQAEMELAERLQDHSGSTVLLADRLARSGEPLHPCSKMGGDLADALAAAGSVTATSRIFQAMESRQEF